MALVTAAARMRIAVGRIKGEHLMASLRRTLREAVGQIDGRRLIVRMRTARDHDDFHIFPSRNTAC